MSTFALLLLLGSAVMHAAWNLLVKHSGDKIAFIWWMFAASLILMQATVLALPGAMPDLSWPVLLLAIAGAGCFALFHLLNGMAYRQDADLSLIYPLSQTSMLWVPLWGVLFLGEKLSAQGLFGILLVVAGAYGVQLQTLAPTGVLRPFREGFNPAILCALGAGLSYSFGALSDKTGVGLYSPFYFTYLLVIFMWLFLSLNLFRAGFGGRLKAEWNRSRHLVLLAGPVLMGSFLPFRFGLQMAPVSYAVQIRQASLLVGVLVGVMFLKESCGRIRLLSAGLIIAGVVAIRLS